MIEIYLIVLGFYLALVLIAGIIFLSHLLSKTAFDQYHPKDVVVPFRNEAENLDVLCQEITSFHGVGLNRYIFVDDHSEDDSLQVLQKFNITVEKLAKNEYGKKAALIKGAKKSKADYLIFNDADIVYGKQYEELLQNNPNFDFDIMILPVWIRSEQSILNQLIRLDYAQVLLATYAFKGNLGSGANMMVNRTKYLQYSDKLEHKILSGDDYFLIRECRRQKGKIVYTLDQGVNVYTKSPKTLKALIGQRSRWIKKSFQKGSVVELFATLAGIFYYLLPYLFVLNYFTANDISYLKLLFVKFLIDLLIFIPALYFNKALRLLYLLPLLEILYPIYYLAVLLGTVSGKKWKGRDI